VTNSRKAAAQINQLQGGGLNFVDFVTNAAVLGEVDLRQHLPQLIQGKLSLELLPGFLHEAAHHTCFMSPVGNALALLRMRAYRQLARQRRFPENISEDLLEDHYRYAVTLDMMRPLAEGIACFQEFDSVAGSSNVITPPLMAALWCFGKNEHLTPIKMTAEMTPSEFGSFQLFSLLFHTRLHYIPLREAWRKRRMDVLADPFSNIKDGYLAGYLTAKGFWKHALLHTKTKLDRELFLSHLKSYFYDDYVFAALIVNRGTSLPDSINCIGNYFRDRIRKYFSLPLEQSFEEFDRSNSAQGGISELGRQGGDFFAPRFDGLGISREDARLGEEALRGLFQEVLDKPGTSTKEEEMRQVDRAIQRRRELLCIGSTDAEIEVNAHQRVIARPYIDGKASEIPMLAAPALAEAQHGKGPGSVEVYFLPGMCGRAVLVARERQCVYAHFDPNVPKSYQERLMCECGHRSADLQYIRDSEAALQTFLKSDPIAQEYEKCLEGFADQTVNLYLGVAGSFIEGSIPWKRLKPILRDGGVYGVLNRDLNALKSLALLGLMSSVGVDEAKEVATHFQSHRLDLAAFRVLNQNLRGEGVTVMADTGEKLWAMV